jgi:hypothetical protein
VPTRLRQELAKLQVEVNEEKSTTDELDRGDSFGFLGFEFRRARSRSGATRSCGAGWRSVVLGVAGIARAHPKPARRR